MAPEPERILVDNEAARKIVAELSALLGDASPSAPAVSGKKEPMTIAATATVRDLAVEIPNATRIFEKLGIDYCCGGHKPLEEACATANVPLERVLHALKQGEDAPPPAIERDWTTAPLGELVDHIVETHHLYVKSEIPRLLALLAKVAGVHGKNHPELGQVQQAFLELANELSGHLMKEEQILFPYVKQMAGGGESGPNCFGTVQNPIRMMMLEHDNAGAHLREIRRATGDYALPADACFSYGTLFNALIEFERDLHQHIHLENNILFPRAIELEAQ